MPSVVKVKRARLEGISGILHETEIAEYNGKEYVLVNLSENNNNDIVFKYLAKLVLCIDLNMPPLVIVNPGTSIPKKLEYITNRYGGIVLEANSVILKS